MSADMCAPPRENDLRSLSPSPLPTAMNVEKRNALRPRRSDKTDFLETATSCDGSEQVHKTRFAQHIRYRGLNASRYHTAHVEIEFVRRIDGIADCGRVDDFEIAFGKSVALFEQIVYIRVYNAADSVQSYGNGFVDHGNELRRHADKQAFAARKRSFHCFGENFFRHTDGFAFVQPLAVAESCVFAVDAGFYVINGLRFFAADHNAHKAGRNVENDNVFACKRIHKSPIARI